MNLKQPILHRAYLDSPLYNTFMFEVLAHFGQETLDPHFSTGTAALGDLMDFRSLVVQVQYWNGRSRRPDGFSFSGSTTSVLERSFSAT